MSLLEAASTQAWDRDRGLSSLLNLFESEVGVVDELDSAKYFLFEGIVEGGGELDNFILDTLSDVEACGGVSGQVDIVDGWSGLNSDGFASLFDIEACGGVSGQADIVASIGESNGFSD